MYEFAYRILFQDGFVLICGEDYLARICEDKAMRITRIQRVEVHRDDWHEVTAATMQSIRNRIGATQ